MRIKFKHTVVNDNGDTITEGFGRVIEISDYDTSTIRVMDLIRKQAKLQNWVGIAGIKEFCKTEYNATINFSTKTNHWTSITFKDQEHFKQFIGEVNNG
jgi:hypothetical protein